MSAVQARSADTASRVDVAVAELDVVLGSELSPIRERYAALAEAVGATLAGPLWATAALPVADTAAMDGFAVSGPGPRWRMLIGTCTAGRRSRIALADGEAVRIATGALTPPGTTAVIRSEHVYGERFGGQATIAVLPGAPRRNDTRVRGESWSDGDELAAAGMRVDASVISVAQSAETPIAMIRGPLRADVLLTGDEIRATGELAPGQVRDALGAVLPHYLGHCDIGVRRLTRLPDGRILLALPGNPLAAVAATLVTGRSLVRALTRRTDSASSWGRIADAAAPDDARTRIVPVRQVEGGVWRATGTSGTAHLAALLQAQSLALLPAGTGRGALVELLPLPR
ncbi:molybdopterin biosynthesis protein [Nocardia tengchongensis]|uniref:molybdopterin biosynthesis protein n=1 Tax=Nocardia tengchongensis TaxID=2055889 RepID=UPI0036CAE81F